MNAQRLFHFLLLVELFLLPLVCAVVRFSLALRLMALLAIVVSVSRQCYLWFSIVASVFSCLVCEFTGPSIAFVLHLGFYLFSRLLHRAVSRLTRLLTPFVGLCARQMPRRYLGASRPRVPLIPVVIPFMLSSHAPLRLPRLYVSWFCLVGVAVRYTAPSWEGISPSNTRDVIRLYILSRRSGRMRPVLSLRHLTVCILSSTVFLRALLRSVIS